LALGPRIKLAGAALLICFVAGAANATAAKPKPKPPTFKVTVKATYVHHHVITLIAATSPNNGCSQRYDVDATQTITVATTTPVVRTLAQITHGTFPAMKAHEVRNGTGRDGWEPGCPALADDPAELEDVSGCGAQDYTIANTTLGFLAPTSRHFAFTYHRNAADPYDGNCFAGIYLDPNSDALNELVDFPPDPFGTATGAKPFWVDVPRTRLTSGKPIVLSWKDTATVSEPFIGDDPSYLSDLSVSQYSVSWDVTLVPIKPKP
jgi:hypothetical protein